MDQLMRKAAVLTLGCKANQFESAAMQEQLENAGFAVGSLSAETELVVINTCTVTGATDSQSRKLVRRARRISPEARIFVTGCAAQVDPSMFTSLPGVEGVFGNMEKQNLQEYLSESSPRVNVGDIAQAQNCPALKIRRFAGHSRAFVQIQTGCDNFCSYCIIPYARGRSRSVPCADVVEQIQILAAGGFQEIVLTGIHIGRYGKDLPENIDLAFLVETILRRTHVARIRLGSVEPQEVTPALLHLIATSERVCSHLHIPLQSGADTVLERMKRTYTRAYFRDLIAIIKQRIPDISLGLDVITGFPGEDTAEFEQTRSLLEELPFNHLHVFPYSNRKGTLAARMPAQVPVAVRRERAALLRDMARSRSRHYARGFIGTRVDAVFRRHPEPEPSGVPLWKGLSGEYLEVECVSNRDLGGRLQRVVVEDVRGSSLLCSDTEVLKMCEGATGEYIKG